MFIHLVSSDVSFDIVERLKELDPSIKIRVVGKPKSIISVESDLSAYLTKTNALKYFEESESTNDFVIRFSENDVEIPFRLVETIYCI